MTRLSTSRLDLRSRTSLGLLIWTFEPGPCLTCIPLPGVRNHKALCLLFSLRRTGRGAHRLESAP